jgi:hypothetical protein
MSILLSSEKLKESVVIRLMFVDILFLKLKYQGDRRREDEKSTKKMRWCEHLKHLRVMERSRLYDHPSNNEIVYYLQIRDYIQAVILFFHSKQQGL